MKRKEETQTEDSIQIQSEERMWFYLDENSELGKYFAEVDAELIKKYDFKPVDE